MNSDNRTDAAASSAQSREYQERLDRYGQDFLQVLRLESPPSPELRQGLRQLQQSLGLADQDVDAIETQVSHSFDTETRTYREYLYRYEQEFAAAVEREFPISPANQTHLWSLQEELGLQSADVIKIEGHILSKQGEQPLAIDSLAALSPFPEPIVISPDREPVDSPRPDPQYSEPSPDLNPQDYRLPDPLAARLVDDIDLDSVTSPPFSQFSNESTTHIPRSAFVEPDLSLQPPSLPNTQLDPPDLRSDRNIDYSHLQALLETSQWEKADEETLALMLQASGRSQEGWLDATAIANFPCTDLQTIDRLWGRYSNEQFSFRVQYRLYSGITISNQNAINPSRSDEERALQFSKTVGWWTKNLEFLKYYNKLDFGDQAPDGHLPALWYWTIPWLEALKYGGIGSGRGGCRIDHQTLTAFIERLDRCGFQ
jgi:GUN4-like